jgi:L-aminopeptidase/D-esterase-like protein
MPADATGSITDVAGITVGHHQRRTGRWRTGTTVVMCPGGATAGCEVRGGGPGTRETDALAPWNLVEEIHSLCLTGGSAYGLAAADGVMAHLAERGLGFPVGPTPTEVVPVVPTAVIFDLGRGGSFTARPDATFGARAAAAATSRDRSRGSVGAGTGAMAGGLRGGVGTASTTVSVPTGEHGPELALTVGALCVVNARGSLIDSATGAPWVRHPLVTKPSAAERRALLDHLSDATTPTPLNTTIGVVATDAVLTRPEATRLAMSGHDGLAHAIRPVHTLADGDTIFSLATRRVDIERPDRLAIVNALLTAAADTVALACVDAIVNATSAPGAVAYADVCPTAIRMDPR